MGRARQRHRVRRRSESPGEKNSLSMGRPEAGLGSVQVIECAKGFFGNSFDRIGFGKTHAPTMRDSCFDVITTSRIFQVTRSVEGSNTTFVVCGACPAVATGCRPVDSCRVARTLVSAASRLASTRFVSTLLGPNPKHRGGQRHPCNRSLLAACETHPGKECRDDSRHGRHECPRHVVASSIPQNVCPSYFSRCLRCHRARARYHGTLVKELSDVRPTCNPPDHRVR